MSTGFGSKIPVHNRLDSDDQISKLKGVVLSELLLGCGCLSINGLDRNLVSPASAVADIISIFFPKRFLILLNARGKCLPEPQ
jgi:hypothetical protein